MSKLDIVLIFSIGIFLLLGFLSDIPASSTGEINSTSTVALVSEPFSFKFSLKSLLNRFQAFHQIIHLSNIVSINSSQQHHEYFVTAVQGIGVNNGNG